MVAAVAHGIRNPLANIRASAQLARLDCAQCRAPLSPENIDHIIGEVDGSERSLKELLPFGQPPAQRRSPLDVD